MPEAIKHGPISESINTDELDDVAKLFSNLDNLNGEELFSELKDRLVSEADAESQIFTEDYFDNALAHVKNFAAKVEDQDLANRCLAIANTAKVTELSALEDQVIEITADIDEKILSKIDPEMRKKHPAYAVVGNLAAYLDLRRNKEIVHPNRIAYIRELFESQQYGMIALELSVTYKQLENAYSQRQSAWKISIIEFPENYERLNREHQRYVEKIEQVLMDIQAVIEKLSPNFAPWLLNGNRILSSLEDAVPPTAWGDEKATASHLRVSPFYKPTEFSSN
jgi:hypothetical protein